jgi:hypothetical protein
MTKVTTINNTYTYKLMTKDLRQATKNKKAFCNALPSSSEREAAVSPKKIFKLKSEYFSWCYYQNENSRVKTRRVSLLQ